MKTIHNQELTFIKYFKENKKRVLWLILSSFLFAFASTSLLTKASTIPTGLSAISITISFIITETKPYLTFIYLLLNIPLFIIFWNKTKKEYIYATLTFLVTNAIFGFLIAFDFGSFINPGKPASLDSLIEQNVLILCPPGNTYESQYAQQQGIKNIMSVRVSDFLKWLQTQPNQNIDALNDIINSSGGKTLGVQKGWPIFVYMLSAVSLAGVSGAFAWKCGGSTGGTDIIAYYYSTKKKKPVGTLLMMIGFLIVTISLILIWSLAVFGPDGIKRNINGFQSLVGLQTISSIIYVVLYGKLLNAIYPKYEKQIVKIDTVNLELIKNYFKEINFKHPYKIHTLTSGKTGKEIYTIETVVLLLESEDLIKEIKKVDPTAWISKLDIKNTYGRFDYSKVE